MLTGYFAIYMTKKLLAPSFLALLIIIGNVSCASPSAPANLLTVSVEPLRCLTEQIAGDAYRVTTLVPEGANPEASDPTFAQLSLLAQSKACFSVGRLGFEIAWIDRLRAAAPNVPFIELDSCAANGDDPHIWTSPSSLRSIARRVCDELCRLDSARAKTFKSNLCAVEAHLDTLDARLRALLDSPAHKAFLIYHPSLTLFARDYNLQQITLEDGGKEPSPARLADIIRQAKKQNVGIILIQKEFDSRNAQFIAQETGARLEIINPLEYNYASELLRIAQILHNP